MTLPESDLPDQVRVEVETACGGKMTLADDTPRAAYNDSEVYFCLEECRTSFQENPLNSCLADRIKSQAG